MIRSSRRGRDLTPAQITPIAVQTALNSHETHAWPAVPGPAAANGVAQPSATPGITANILVVDDDSKSLFASSEILRELGENVITAQSGSEALRCILRHEFAVILLDVHMPDLDGYETAALIRGREKTRHVPIIFLSAVNKDADHIYRGYSLGAVDYVFKPINPLILKSKITVFVELYKKSEEVRRQAEAERLLQLENLRVRAEKSEAERALRRVEERQALIIRSLPVALYTAEFGSAFSGPRFLSERISSLIGFPAQQFVDDPDLWVSRIHPADRDRVLAQIATLPNDGAALATEYRWECADGAERVFLDQGVLVRDDDGTPREILGTCLDVTERKHMEQQLFQAQKMEAVGQLTGGIAHDFNNMLTVVVGNLDLLARALKGSGKNFDRVQMALSGAKNCADLTRRLLAFASRQRLQPTAIDLCQMLSGMVQLLRQTLGETIVVELRIADEVGAAVADPAQVESAVMNLAINARDAMPTGGKLVIEAANATLEDEYAAQNPGVVPGEYVMLAVCDTGSGMPADVMARALDPFFTTKPPGQGTGLGLSMVYGFVRQSGGHMKIESEVEQGTTIRLYLPRTDQQVASAEPKNGSASLEVSGAGRVVLLAEDDAGVRAVAVAQLQELGYRVIEAVDGPSALDALRKNERIDLLLTDMVMPGGMTGLDLAREAKQQRPELKVLYTSGYSTSFAAPGAAPGVLLQKPFRDEDLARELSRAFRQQDA